MKKLFEVWAYGNKVSRYVVMTNPCSEEEATRIVNCLQKIDEIAYTSVYSNFLIKEISCSNCVYRNEKQMCWSTKGACDTTHPKCDYRLNTQLQATIKTT